ncbi:cadherin domain-containing protein, partial [Microcystis aeruginosa]|uniref:cadherin domain-containing protein n=1 Tax=Microcystis aeruginosa TaxID=1126 RepID=UPI0020A55424
MAAAESLVLLAFDPNDILGPTGFGDQNYLIPNHDFPYTIRFENLKSATAPAVFVTVTHTIDTDLNLDTFQLGDFGFGSIYVDVPDGLKAYSTSVDLTSTIGYFVDFEASLDTATRTVTWRLTTIDPLTGGLPLDPEAGFLPPNNDTHDGEGFINYTISPNANLTTNTTIDAEARIVFDFNSPIDTPKWTNTIDVDKPTSQVTALLTNSNTTFNVTWSGSDEGSGIASYDIYVSTDNGAYTLWKDNITATSAPFEGQPGKTYRFYSVATDNLGLIETAPTQPDATTTVGTVNVGPTDLALSATTVNENVPVNTVIGTFSSTDPDTGNTFTYSLIAGTGDTDNTAFSIVGNQLQINNSPDFETKNSYSIRVKTTDQGGLSFEKTLTITVNDVNENPSNQAPTDLALSATTVNENVPVNTVIGTFSSTDPDTGNTFTYSLIAGTGDTDNTAFSIVGNQSQINNSPDFETKNSYSIRVKTTDQGGLSFEKTLTITVNDVNETPGNQAPTNLALSATTVNENVPVNTVIGTFSSTDPDTGNTFTYSLVTGTGDTDNSAFLIVGNQLQINNSPDFETKNSYSIRVKTTDQGGLSFEKTLTIAVNDVNETPTNQAPTDLALSASTVDENVPVNTVIGTFSSTDPDTGNSFTYSLIAGTGDTDNTAFSIVGNQLQINNSPDFETKNSYSIRVKTTDQGGLSFEKTLTITVNDVNETPSNQAP